jgi:hypothetical protein
MSTNTLLIEQYIKEENINYYEYNEFNNIEELGSGSVSKVYRVNWQQECKALKSFSLDHAVVEEIVREVRSRFMRK